MAEIKIFNIAKYHENFLKTEDIRALGSQAAQIKIPTSPWWLAAIFVVLKILAFEKCYSMFKNNQENDMALDKQAFDQNLNTNLENDNEVIVIPKGMV